MRLGLKATVCVGGCRLIEALWADVTETAEGEVLLPAAACTLLQQKLPLLQGEMTSSLRRDAFLSALIRVMRHRARHLPDRQALLPSMSEPTPANCCCSY